MSVARATVSASLLLAMFFSHPVVAQPPTSGLAFWINASDLNADGMANNPADGTLVGDPDGVNWQSAIPIDLGGTPTPVQGYAEDPAGYFPERAPMYVASAINGKPAVRFDIGTTSTDPVNNDALQFRAVGGGALDGYKMDVTKTYTAFVVEQYEVPSDGTYFSTVNPFSGDNGDLVRVRANGQLRMFSGGGFRDNTGLHAPGAGIVTVSNMAVSGGGAAPQEMWVNGTSIGTLNLSRSSTVSHNLSIGTPQGNLVGAGLFGYRGDIAEMLIYERTLSAAELNQVGFYLEQKYSLDTAYVASSLPGDVNFDGVVNIFDINLVSSNWGGSGPTGDANGDMTVNIFDINLISSNWTPPGNGSAVPEPSSWVLIALGGALSVWRLQRRGRNSPPT